MRLGVIDKVACDFHNNSNVSDECVLSFMKGCPFINLNLFGVFCSGYYSKFFKNFFRAVIMDSYIVDTALFSSFAISLYVRCSE